MNNKLTYLVLHCSATIEGIDYNADDIRRMHMGPAPQDNGAVIWNGLTYQKREDLPDIIFYGRRLKDITGRGWKQVGYSDFIHLDGRVENLVQYDEDNIVQPREITNGALGLNGVARHVMYLGGVDKALKPKDTRTTQQAVSLQKYILDTIKKHPDIIVLGHNQVASKACPSFHVPTYLKAIGVAEKNIYKK